MNEDKAGLPLETLLAEARSERLSLASKSRIKRGVHRELAIRTGLRVAAVVLVAGVSSIVVSSVAFDADVAEPRAPVTKPQPAKPVSSVPDSPGTEFSVPNPEPPSPLGEPEEAEALEVIASPRAQAPSVRVPTEAETGPLASPDPESTLLEEVALLRRARSALDQGNPSGAFQALREHRERFPQGVLSLDRDATAWVARCEMNPSAAPAALEFARRHPGLPLTERIRRTCGPERTH